MYAAHLPIFVVIGEHLFRASDTLRLAITLARFNFSTKVKNTAGTDLQKRGTNEQKIIRRGVKGKKERKRWKARVLKRWKGMFFLPVLFLPSFAGVECERSRTMNQRVSRHSTHVVDGSFQSALKKYLSCSLQYHALSCARTHTHSHGI